MSWSSTSDPIRSLLRARDGEPSAVPPLLETYRSYTMLMARLHLPAELQGKLSASDLTQETLLRAHQAFGQFRGTTEAELLAWLRRILASRLARHLRHYSAQQRNVRAERRLEESMHGSSEALSRAFAGTDTTPSRHAMRREDAVMLADALAALPAEHREVLVLRHLEELNFPEIARRMGRELESVKSLWRRALKRLRDQIIEQG